MLVQDRRTAGHVQGLTPNEDVAQVEGRAHGTIHQEQHHSGHEDREAQHAEDGGDQEGPDGQRQAEHLHAFRPQVDHGHDVIQTTEQGARHEQHHGDEPEGHTRATAWHGLRQRTERRVHRPSTGCRTTLNEEGEHHDQAGDEKEPVAQHVQETRRHVACPDLKRDEQVRERAAQSPGQHEEHHDGAVDGDQGEVSVPVEDAARRPLAEEGLEDAEGLSRPSELEAEEDGKSHGEDPHEDSRNQELLRDHLVILAEDVLGDEALLVVCVCAHGVRFVQGFSGSWPFHHPRSTQHRPSGSVRCPAWTVHPRPRGRHPAARAKHRTPPATRR